MLIFTIGVSPEGIVYDQPGAPLIVDPCTGDKVLLGVQVGDKILHLSKRKPPVIRKDGDVLTLVEADFLSSPIVGGVLLAPKDIQDEESRMILLTLEASSGMGQAAIVAVRGEVLFQAPHTHQQSGRQPVRSCAALLRMEYEDAVQITFAGGGSIPYFLVYDQEQGMTLLSERAYHTWDRSRLQLVLR